MILSMSAQARLFFMTVAVGFIIGVVYDIFRILRKTVRHPDFLTQLEDLLFWLMVSVIMFYFMLNKNYGEIRMFSILGAFLGAILYFCILSPFIVKFCVAFINTVASFIKKAVLTLLKIILYPFKLIWKVILFPFGLLQKNVFKPMLKSLQNLFVYVKIKVSRTENKKE